MQEKKTILFKDRPKAPVHDPLSFMQSLMDRPEYEPLDPNPAVYRFMEKYGHLLLYIHLGPTNTLETEKYLTASVESLGCFIPFDFVPPNLSSIIPTYDEFYFGI